MYSGLRKDLVGVVGYDYLLENGERKGAKIFYFLLKGWNYGLHLDWMENVAPWLIKEVPKVDKGST